MGSSSWSDKDYQTRQTHRAATGASAFTHHQHVTSTGRFEVHEDMDPKKMKSFAGFPARESRDSESHPQSVPIAIWFDVTGSMGMIPRILQKKLGQAMKVIVGNGYVTDPQILFGAIGDARTDRVPLQLGQFESGLEMDDCLGKIFLEGNGGGQVSESYELIPFMMSRHTVTDAWEKRGRKGYLFTIGDEKPCPFVKREHVKELVGVDIEADIKFEDIVAEVLEKWEWFHIIPLCATDENGAQACSYHGQDPEVQEAWKKVLNERVIILEDGSAMCETISLYIGFIEGAVDSADDGKAALVSAGVDASSAQIASTALSTYTGSRSVAKAGRSNLQPAPATGDDAGRL